MIISIFRFIFLLLPTALCKLFRTSDAGSQYRCGRMGRGSQPPSTPNNPHTQKAFTTIVFQVFDSRWRTDQRTNRRTDKASYKIACPQLKTNMIGISFNINKYSSLPTFSSVVSNLCTVVIGATSFLFIPLWFLPSAFFFMRTILS